MILVGIVPIIFARQVGSLGWGALQGRKGFFRPRMKGNAIDVGGLLRLGLGEVPQDRDL
jgi:hypothetical protein